MQLLKMIFGEKSPPASLGPVDFDAIKKAVKAQGEDAALRFIKKGMDFSPVVDEKGNTLLTWAASCPHLKIARKLIDCGADPNQRGDHGAPPIVVAGIIGDIPTLSLLLKKGATIDAASAGVTAIMRAAQNNHHEAIDFLAGKGANIDAQADYHRSTALFWAARGGHREALHALIRHHAGLDIADSDGMTPLHEAIRSCRMDPAQALLAAGANVDARNKNGSTPLMFAGAQYGPGEDCTRMLIKCRAKLDLQNEFGETALMWAVTDGSEKSALALIEAHADLNLQDVNGNTALMRAINHGQRDAAKAMIAKGTRSNVKNNAGQTALFWAATKGDAEIVGLLLAAGADPLAVDAEGRTALSYLGDKSPEALKILAPAEEKSRALRERAYSEGATVLKSDVRLHHPLQLKKRAAQKL